VDFVQRLSDESNRERLRSLGIGRVELDECRVLATRIAKGNREAG
jgi:hypothetical protein